MISVPQLINPPIEKRGDDRTQVNWKARCFTRTDTFWDITILDTSEGGFGLSEVLPLEIGDRLKIAIDGIGVFPCKMVWKARGRCGISLLDEDHDMSTDDVAALDSVFANLDTRSVQP